MAPIPMPSSLRRICPTIPFPACTPPPGSTIIRSLALPFWRGANPNDSESLYHSTEHRDLACVRLLLRHGATPAGTNALKHMLDREDIEGLKLLLASGANPNEVNDRGETALHWAVWRGRSMETIATLLDN